MLLYKHVTPDKAEQLKKTLKGYKTLTPPIRSALEEFGFRITDDSKHYKLVYRGDRITLARSTHGETM